jgi:hypothetical protein
MWNAATITALCTGIAGILAAAGTVIGLVLHRGNTAAHALHDAERPAPSEPRKPRGLGMW